MNLKTYSRKNHGTNAHLKPRLYFYASEDVDALVAKLINEKTEFSNQQLAEYKEKLKKVINGEVDWPSYEIIEIIDEL